MKGVPVLNVFELYELALDGEPGPNPFDPDQASVDAVVTRPDGSAVTVPGFWTEDFLPGPPPQALGKPHWCLRFCPAEAGTYRVRAVLTLGGKAVSVTEASFAAVAGPAPGFVRVAPAGRPYFALSTGRPYFPLGYSVCWTSRDHTLEDFERYFADIAGGGGDWTRVWNATWSLPLEWSKDPSVMGHTGGLGAYALDNAWLLDRVLERAGAHGIRVLLTLGNYGDLMEDKGPWGEERWAYNPYNKAMGGPAATPAEFFTSPVARALFRRRLRYIAARWGWSPWLFGIELFNEYKAPPDWVAEMAAAWAALDPNRHLVGNSVAYPWGESYDEDRLWELPGVAWTQEHYYGPGDGKDMAALVLRRSGEHARFAKPFFFEELGLDASKDDAKADLRGEGEHLRQALWASVVGGSAAGPMSHWKETMLSRGLAALFRPLRAFTDGVDFAGQDFRPFTRSEPLRGAAADADLEIPLAQGWDDAGSAAVAVDVEGRVQGQAPRFLRSTRRDHPQGLTLDVDAPRGAGLVLRIDEVSAAADLRLSIDGKPAWSQAFNAAPGSGDPYASTAKDPRWGTDKAQYHRDYPVDLPPGRHRIRVDSVGQDWASLEGLRLTGWKRAVRLELDGLRSDRFVLGWIRDPRCTYEAAWAGTLPAPVAGASFDLEGLHEGAWTLAWWDTRSGEESPPEAVDVTGGRLRLAVPGFSRDIAFQLRR